MKTRLYSFAALVALAFSRYIAPSVRAVAPPDPGGGGGAFVKYVGSSAGDLWSVPANWLDGNNNHRIPANNDDIFIGAPIGTNTTDDISLVADYLDFYEGTNLLTISGGAQLVINPSGTVGINVRSGASAFIYVTGTGSLLQLDGTATSDGVALELDSGGEFAISPLTGSGAAIGSLEGTNGTVDLGAKTLTAGSLNTFTNYNGTITGAGGSLTKVGTGALVLGQANTYSGSTNINAGTLAIGDSGALGTSALTIGETGSSNSVNFNIATGGNVNIANSITVSSLASGPSAHQEQPLTDNPVPSARGHPGRPPICQRMRTDLPPDPGLPRFRKDMLVSKTLKDCVREYLLPPQTPLLPFEIVEDCL